MKDKKGFTLTELLAVIVLIGVILAIAVPSYQSYVTRTRKEVLESYQANIIDAANQYAAECIVKNTLVENFGQKNIWEDLNFKNKAAIEKDYDAIEVYIEAGKSKASDLYCIRIKSTKNNSIDYYTTCLGKDSASTSEITIGDKKYTGTSPIIKGGSLVITGNIKKIKVDDNDDNIINCKTRGIQTAKSICNLPQDLKDGEHKITYGDGKTLRFVMDKTSPKIETSNINTSPTNKVEFTVTITDKNLKEVTKFPKECKIEEDKETTKKYICTITENGEYSFSAIDKADNTEAKDITISNITSEKPSVILNIDSEAVSKSKIIEIEYISGSNGNEIGFNTDQKLKWSLINTSNNQEERTGEFTNLSNKGSQNVKIEGLTGTYSFIVKGLTNKAGNKNDDEKLKSKIRDQISYLEKDLISMLNGFNNISYSNYKIEKKQGAQSSQTNTLIEENKKQGSTNGESLQETKRNNDSVEKSSNESESDNMNDNNSNASNQGNSSIIMVPNSILLSDINQKIDWNNMKYEIEKIYSTWNSLFIDLNSLEKGNTKTLEFSSTLNDTTKSIKAENKIASMQNIAEMYIKLGDYSKSYTNDNLQINIIDTKKNIIQAYVYVTENNWDMALNSINKADESFGNVINNVSAQPANQSNINKAYVLLKEEKKAIDLKDQDIFFINYKMIMQELYDI